MGWGWGWGWGCGGGGGAGLRREGWFAARLASTGLFSHVRGFPSETTTPPQTHLADGVAERQKLHPRAQARGGGAAAGRHLLHQDRSAALLAAQRRQRDAALEVSGVQLQAAASGGWGLTDAEPCMTAAHRSVCMHLRQHTTQHAADGSARALAQQQCSTTPAQALTRGAWPRRAGRSRSMAGWRQLALPRRWCRRCDGRSVAAWVPSPARPAGGWRRFGCIRSAGLCYTGCKRGRPLRRA